MPELNFNLLVPTADLSYEPQVKMDPVAAYEKAKATRQSNMLAQLYAKHYDPQTGGVNYNALIGDAAQSDLAEHIPSIMKEAQTQAQSQAVIEHNKQLAAQEAATAAAKQQEMDRAKLVNMATDAYSRLHGVKNADELIAWHTANPEPPGTNKEQTTADLKSRLAQYGYDAVRSEIEGRLQDITGIEPEKVAETELAKNIREQKNYAKGSPEWNAYQGKINELSGGMTQYQQQSLQIERDKVKLLQDKANKGDTTADAGKELLTSQVISLRDTYDALSEKGGIVDTKAPWYKNLGAWVSSTGPGQTVGKALGTDTQSLRNTIAQSRPLLLNAIKQATGMTAKQMDSNVELQMYLRAATDPTADIQSNRKALQKLNDLFGLGIDLGPIESSAAPSPALGGAGMGAGAQMPPQDQAALDWANKNPKDPRAAKIKAKLGVK